MSETRFSDEHTWARFDDDGSALVGISEHAAEQLGDIVFVEPPEPGRDITQGEEIGVIESVKTTGELHAPLGGTVEAVNEAVVERPELVNESPLDDGWLFRMRVDDDTAFEALMDEHAYGRFVESLD
ncbi:MAG: glycine cleavage system protein GcvH [Gammaproteobacteria bacterium]